jgi:HPt (histidine-containing phosphotransfer) domain-containing protein
MKRKQSDNDKLAIGGTVEQPPISSAELAALAEMIGPGMNDVLVDLLDTYRDESAGYVATLVEALHEGNAADMLRPAHNLKSSSASIGARRLSQLSETLEEHLRAPTGALDIPFQVQLIADEHARVAAALVQERARLTAGQ